MIKEKTLREFDFSRISRIKNLVINLLFPKFCVGCGEEGGWLCLKCSDDIVPVISQVCPGCGRLSENGRYCSKCRFNIIKKKIPGKKKLQIIKRIKPLEGIIAAAYFEEGPVKEMIHNLKYNGVIELSKPLANLMASALMSNNKLQMSNEMSNTKLEIRNLKLVISFAPLYWKRRAERGYNQAELLARAVGEKMVMPAVSLLKKIKNTSPQVRLTGKKRRENLAGVFKLRDPRISLKSLTVILIDDVYTTGSTLNECARVLKAAGAREVWGLVVARG